MQITIITPIHNDWKNLEILVEQLSLHLSNTYELIQIIAINDCSTENFPDDFKVPVGVNIIILNLAINVGHQRAIVIGLCYLYEIENQSNYVIIMDSDGEDKPSDTIRMLFAQKEEIKPLIIFAERNKRSEGFVFKLFYIIYRFLFMSITGKEIKFGNFSCIPKSFLPLIIHNSDFWNHFSSAVVKSKLPYKSIKTSRGVRYLGVSKMNFNALVIHGLSALSLYLDILIVKLLKISIWGICLIVISLGVLFYIKYFTSQAIPGWTSFLVAILLNIFITIALFITLIILQHLNNRNQKPSHPIDFYMKFILRIDKLIK